MLFQLQYYKYEPNEYFPLGQRNYYFRVSINLRGADETLYSYGECSRWEDSIFCGVDDDGGGLTIAPNGDGGITVGWDALISRPRTSVGPNEGESSPTYALTPDDGKEFPLDHADLALCEPPGQERLAPSTKRERGKPYTSFNTGPLVRLAPPRGSGPTPSRRSSPPARRYCRR